MSKIFIVEDDKFLKELISKKLKSEGFEIDCAMDGEEALEKLKSSKFDLILLDLILPGMDGFKTLEKLKEDAKLSSIPVIILSNLGQREDIEKGMKLGAVDYLVKAHFTPNEIVEKIKKVLKE